MIAPRRQHAPSGSRDAATAKRGMPVTSTGAPRGVRRGLTSLVTSLGHLLAFVNTKIADVEAGRQLARQYGVTLLSEDTRKPLPASVTRVSQNLATVGPDTFSVIVKRPPVRLRPWRGEGDLSREGRVLDELPPSSRFGFEVPTCIALARGRLLGGEILVMGRVSGDLHSDAEWYAQNRIRSLTEAYGQIHLSEAPGLLRSGIPIHRLSELLFEELPERVKDAVVDAGGMPQGLVHGDPQTDNWLWDEDGNVSAIVDWAGAHCGWIPLEVARCGLRLAQQVGVEVGLTFVDEYLALRPIDGNVMSAAHQLAARWPLDVQSAKSPRTCTPTNLGGELKRRREEYLSCILQ